MRKLRAAGRAAGLFAAGALGLSLVASGPASAAATTYIIDGTFSGVLQICTQITFAFSGSDCSYGRNRPGANGTWLGPLFGGGNYAKDSPQSLVSYIPTVGDNLPQGSSAQANFIPAVPDGKLNAPLAGELIIDDNGTPGNPTDDIVSGSFTIGALARNVPTGQFTRAVQQWTTMDNTIVPTPVNPTATVANGAGGVDYVVGSRGFPTPRCYRYNAADCYPTENSMPDFADSRFWGPLPPAGSVGIERSGILGDPAFTPVQPPPVIPTGNVGARTTATLTGSSCVTNNGAVDDCTVSSLIWGAGEDVGFDNLIMKISTNSSGQITSALVYWTQEFFIGAFSDPVLEVGYNNSASSSTINFTGLAEGLGPNARDFAASVIQGSTNNSLNASGNCVNFTGPVTVSIDTPPTLGTATVVGSVPTQTINYNSTGATGTDTIVYSCTSGAETNAGTITITVAADTTPGSPNGPISISTQGAAPGTGTAGNVNVSTLVGYLPGNLPSVVSISTPPVAGTGTATVNGTTITFTPSAAPPFFTGTATIGYIITDNDADVSSPAGVITVTIPNVSPVIQDGTITTDQNRASTAQALAITPGNGTIAQGTVAVTTQASNGTCAISGTSAPTLTYTPAANYSGPDSCVVTATDGDGSTDTGTFSITVNAVDDALKLPGGGSAVDLWSLSLLGTLPLLRRRRRA